MKNFFYIAFSILYCILTGLSVYGQSYYVVKEHPVSTRFNNEESPVFMNNQLIFSSNRSNSSLKKYFDEQKRNYFHIYYSAYDTSGKNWSVPKIFSEQINTNLSDGPLAIDSSGNIIVFSRSYSEVRGGKNRNNPYVGLFIADKLGESWSNIREFPFNSVTAQTTHPSLNKAGNILYFASDREGGFGGYDLYVSKLENGSWTPPQNLGPRINTTENEIYPFIHPSGRLYFSSLGHDKKIGGYDIFYSEFYNGQWITPVKLPSPFNSGFKDFTYFSDEKFEKGFFTSNRRGSVDIYTFESNLPTFEICQEQKKDNFCFIFFEENTVEVDTNLYAYEWDLGDSIKVRDVQAHHCYMGPGTYTVKLDVIDKLTQEVLFNQASYELKIERIEQPYISCPDTIIINQDIQFSGQLSYFKSIKPGEYFWDFGDGIKGIGASFRHNYKVPGNYTIRLGVVEDAADTDSLKKFCSFRLITVKE